MLSMFFLVPAIAQLLLTLRLVVTGLVKRYPALAAWMAISALTMLALMTFPSPRAPGYRDAWIARQVLVTLALFAALVELTNRILEHYPGLRRVTASGLFGVLLATSIVAVAGEPLDKPLRLSVLMLSAWNGAASLYVIVLVALTTYLDPRRRQNVILHERVFGASCLLSAASLLFAALYPTRQELATTAGAVGGVVFPLLWMRMSPAGEVDRRPPPHRRPGQPDLESTEAAIERLEKMVTRSSD